MKALVYRSPRNMVLEDRPDPTLEPDEVVVAVAAVGVCGSELHGLRDEIVAVALGAFDRHKSGERLHGAAIECDQFDGGVGTADHLFEPRFVEDILQQLHTNSSVMDDPLKQREPGCSDCFFTIPLPTMRTFSPRFSSM